MSSAVATVLASILLAAAVAGGVLVAGGPVWAAWGFGAVVYLHEAKWPGGRARVRND